MKRSSREDCRPREPEAAGLSTRAQAQLARGACAEAAALLRQRVTEDPQDHAAWVDLGRALNNDGRLKEAEAAFRSAAGLRPDDAPTANYLGHVQRALGRIEPAIASFRLATRLDPGLARAHKNLGTVYRLNEQAGRAERAMRRGLELEPDDAPAQTNLGDLLMAQKRFAEAAACYREALRVDAGYVDALAGLGSALQEQECLEEAVEVYRAALRRDPGHRIAAYGLAAVLELLGSYTEGLALTDSRIEAGLADDDLLVAHARLLRRMGRAEDALDVLTPVVARRERGHCDPPRLDYTLGDLYDETGRYDLAFEHYSRANARHDERFDPAKHAAGVDALIEFFDAATMARLPRAAPVQQQLLFIVGMPRSGTSLAEQILAVHPQVHAGGEVNALYDIVRAMGRELGTSQPYPRCLKTLTRTQVDALAKRYLGTFDASAASAAVITDKLPANFMNLGLIELLFPQARIVHCVREPLDTCLSCYFQNFRSQSFSNDLAHTGAYYREYRRIMAHWRGVIGLPVLQLGYERLVERPEAGMRALVEFAGLDWHPACAEFHRSARVVRTTSYAQVRKPIYSSSVGRHRNYAPHLQPLLAALGDAIATPEAAS